MKPHSERLLRALDRLFGPSAPDLDPTALERLGAALAPLAAPDLTGAMVGVARQEFEGLAGMGAAWAEWIGGFVSVRIEIEAIEEHGENVLILVEQRNTTRHGAVISQPSAAVWKFRDGLLARVEFHTDRGAARESAGIAAAQSSQA